MTLSLVPALAETYTDPTGSVSVAHNGGCAYGTAVAVAVGESGCGYEANGAIAIGLFGADSRGTYGPTVRDPVLGWDWGMWFPGLAVSDTGDAYAPNPGGMALSGTGGAAGSEYAVSGTGDANGLYAIAGDDAATPQDGPIAIALTGDAYAPKGYWDWCMTNEAPVTISTPRIPLTSVAISATGNASGDCYSIAPIGASQGAVAVGGGNAYGGLVAVSATGSASAADGHYQYGAIGWSNSSVERGLVCLSVTGSCYGGLVSVAPNGGARSQNYPYPAWEWTLLTGSSTLPGVAVAEGDASTDGGAVLCVSATGDCSGSPRLAVTPFGHAS